MTNDFGSMKTQSGAIKNQGLRKRDASGVPMDNEWVRFYAATGLLPDPSRRSRPPMISPKLISARPSSR